MVTAKIETSFALERNDPLGLLDDGGPRGTKPRRLSDVHFIDVARDPAVSEILHLSWTGVRRYPRANVILIKSGRAIVSPFDLRVKAQVSPSLPRTYVRLLREIKDKKRSLYYTYHFKLKKNENSMKS